MRKVNVSLKYDNASMSDNALADALAALRSHGIEVLSIGQSKAYNGHRLTRDNVDRDAWLAWAVSNSNLSHAEASVELDKFIDYWLALAGSKGLKANWMATWRNRVRYVNEAKRLSGGNYITDIITSDF